MASDSYDTFEAVKSRLDEIVDAVSDDSLSLDEALALYEEAVGLGLRAGDLLEERIELQDADEEIADDAEALGVDACDSGRKTGSAQFDDAEGVADGAAAEPALDAGYQTGTPASA